MTATLDLGGPELVRRAEDAHALGYFDLARTLYEQALHTRLGPLGPGHAPMVLRRVARCFMDLSDFGAADDCLEAAEASADGHGDAAGVALAINSRAASAQHYGDLSRAVDLYERALTVARAAGADAVVAMLESNLGTIANIRGDLREARLRYDVSLSHYRQLGMQREMSEVLNNLGMLYTDLGDWRAAEQMFAESVRAATTTGDFVSRMRAEVNRVELYIGRRRFRKARRLARWLLTLEQQRQTQWSGEVQKHLGVTARSLGHMDEAERLLTISLAEGERRHDVLLTAETLRELAVVYQCTGRSRETLQTLNRSHALFKQLMATRDMSDVDGRVRQLESEFLAIVHEWGSSIESADHYTQGHCERVATYACALARDVDLDESVLLWFRMGALLHDVGKIEIPAEILNKPGSLTPEEAALMREHAARGDALLSGIAFPWDIRPMVRHHHERWDGHGYPDRLGGTQIPRAARILCIADVFDALTSARSYRGAYAPADAAAMMRRDAGLAFDPELLDVFLARTLPRIRLRGRASELSGATPRPFSAARATPSAR